MHTVQLVEYWPDKLEIECKSRRHTPSEFHPIWSLSACANGEELDYQICAKGRSLQNFLSLGGK